MYDLHRTMYIFALQLIEESEFHYIGLSFFISYNCIYLFAKIDATVETQCLVTIRNCYDYKKYKCNCKESSMILNI